MYLPLGTYLRVLRYCSGARRLEGLRFGAGEEVIKYSYSNHTLLRVSYLAAHIDAVLMAKIHVLSNVVSTFRHCDDSMY